MLANNAKINWMPEHIKDGRFGKFLETNVDWALSRERYWGTPLPIWKCQQTGKMEAVGSYDELMAKPGIRDAEVWEEAKRRNPDLPDDLASTNPTSTPSPTTPPSKTMRGWSASPKSSTAGTTQDRCRSPNGA